MSSASDVAFRKIESMLTRDPVLRDVMLRTLPRPTKPSAFVPDVDVVELEDKFVLVLDVPGVPRDTLSVELEGTKLVVEGEKRLGHPDGGRVKVGERNDGAFRREFLLPCMVQGDMVRARLADGVLTIEVPRAGQTQTVPIQVG